VTANALPLKFPTRGVAGGWRDWWDDPDDSTQLRTQAAAVEQRLEATAVRIGRRWQREIARERAGCAERGDCGCKVSSTTARFSAP
jgi:hypothetical protein